MPTTWDDLLRPGEANNFFNPPPDATPFRFDVTGWNDVTAWWLMELSRVIYCREKTSRAAFLLRARLEEVDFIEERQTETQCMLVAPPSRAWAALVFRGTENIRDWLTNAELMMMPWMRGGRVHAGFRRAFLSIQQKLEDSLREHLPDSTPLFYAGHSLGGALATLAASWRKPAAAYTFGSPYVGDDAFGETLNGHFYRVVNDRDIVATVPLPIPPRLDYVHHGDLHRIGASHTPLDIVTQAPFAPLLPVLHNVTMDSLRDAFGKWATAFVRLVDPPEPLADHAPINYVNLLGEAIGIPARASKLLPPPAHVQVT
jgi:hypothetical protein